MQITRREALKEMGLAGMGPLAGRAAAALAAVSAPVSIEGTTLTWAGWHTGLYQGDGAWLGANWRSGTTTDLYFQSGDTLLFDNSTLDTQYPDFYHGARTLQLTSDVVVGGMTFDGGQDGYGRYVIGGAGKITGSTGSGLGKLLVTADGNVAFGNTGGVFMQSIEIRGIAEFTNTVESADGYFQVVAGGSLTFSGASYKIGAADNQNIVNNGTLTIAPKATPSAPRDYHGVISGTGNFVKAGGDQLTLTQMQSYQGATTVDNGILVVAAGLGGGDYSGLITLAGSAAIPQIYFTNTSGTQYIRTGIVGTGSVRKEGAGVLVLAGANTYTGQTVAGVGELRITGTLGTGANYTGLITTGSLIVFDQDVAQTLSGASFTGIGAVRKEGSGTLTLTKATTYQGATTVSGTGTLALSGAGTLAQTASLTLEDTAKFDISGITTAGVTIKALISASSGTAVALGAKTLTVNQTSATQTTTTEFAGNITGTGGLTKTANGSLTLSGTNTFSGGLTLTLGIVATANASSLGAATGAIAFSGGTLKANADLNLASHPFSATVANSVINTDTGASARTVTLGTGTASTATFKLTQSGTGLVKVGTFPGTISTGRWAVAAGSTIGAVATDVASDLSVDGASPGTVSISQATRALSNITLHVRFDGGANDLFTILGSTSVTLGSNITFDISGTPVSGRNLLTSVGGITLGAGLAQDGEGTLSGIALTSGGASLPAGWVLKLSGGNIVLTNGAPAPSNLVIILK
jgi:autotransporter-associated beta strand protein